MKMLVIGLCMAFLGSACGENGATLNNRISDLERVTSTISELPFGADSFSLPGDGEIGEFRFGEVGLRGAEESSYRIDGNRRAGGSKWTFVLQGR